MNTKIIISFLFIFFTTFICTKQKITNKEQVNLPKIDSSLYKQCYIKYKNSLYDESTWLSFRLNIIYIKPFIFSNIMSDNKESDSIILTNLNNSYKSQGIRFTLYNSKNSYKDYSINDFMNHYKNYEKNGYLTLIVYPSDNAMFSGIAAGSPHTVFGVINSKINTSTLPHEVGHIFSILHIFEKDDTDGKNSFNGDKICDTPAYNIMDNRTVNCGYIGPPKYTEEDLSIIIPNYMNYNSEIIDCRSGFTPIQGLVMRWAIENYPPLYSALEY